MLIVTSKVKQLIKQSAEMNTSAETIDALEKIVKAEVAKAIEKAKADGRKTVMARDVTPV